MSVIAPWPGPISMTRALAHVAESVGDGMAGAIVDKEVLSEFWLTFHRSVTL